MKNISGLLLAVCVTAFSAGLAPVFAQGTAFTYQGRLDDGGAPANGLYDLQFTVFDALSGGLQQGATVLAGDLAVSNGLFAVTLDFGAGVFTGPARWLNVAVRPGASTGTYTNLTPRQPIAPAPYAVFAAGANAAGLTGVLPASVLTGTFGGILNLNNAANTLAGSGSGLTSLNASQMTAGTLADVRLSSNVALRSGGNTFNGSQIFANSVGIGNAAPADPLQIGSLNSAFDQYLSLKTLGGNAYRAGLKFRHFNDTGGFNIEDDEHVGTNGLHIIRYPFGSPVSAMFVDRFSGNVGLGTITPQTTLDVAGDITCVALNITSDRNAKEDFKPVDPRSVLEKVAHLPISEWQYKTQSGVRHVGPMAQDFREAFALGHDERHIATVDEEGVALAAIQGLNQKLEEQAREKDARIRGLESSLSQLQESVAKLLRQQNAGHPATPASPESTAH